MKTSEPEWLVRRDEESGQWTVTGCEPKRGIPATSIITREMRIPQGDNEVERCIRAHEMMHAKVSPGKEFDKWLERNIASERALMVCEELRVNLLCQKAGFDMMKFLTDGGETADGERIAIQGTWADAVYAVIAVAGTASQKKFLTGIRRHNRGWGKALNTIAKRAIASMKKESTLGSTGVHDKTGLSPAGFIYTEKLARWVDRIAQMDPSDKKEEEQEKQKNEDGNSSSIVSKSKMDSSSLTEDDVDNYLERLKKIPPKISGGIPYWGELVIEKLPMPVHTRGNIGKKRTASNVGKSPRRIHRYLTDPEKRIFDKTSRGMGGVVVFDVSGSMSLSHNDVRLIVEASPGATVIAYSYGGDGLSNAWILADKGRMVKEMPSGIGRGNGVDFPALQWAVANKQRSSSPVIWVTDGGVCGPNQGYSDILAMQCIEFCIKNRITLLSDVNDAITCLKAMQRGIKPTTKWPFVFKQTYKTETGNRLV